MISLKILFQVLNKEFGTLICVSGLLWLDFLFSEHVSMNLDEALSRTDMYSNNFEYYEQRI
jgi:hypothetical protein